MNNNIFFLWYINPKQSIPVTVIDLRDDKKRYFLQLFKGHLVIFVIFFVQKIRRICYYFFLPAHLKTLLLVSKNTYSNILGFCAWIRSYEKQFDDEFDGYTKIVIYYIHFSVYLFVATCTGH